MRHNFAKAIGSDPVLNEVESRLAMGGPDPSQIARLAGSGSAQTGQEIMMAHLANKTAETPPSGPAMAAEGGEGSSLALTIGIGAATAVAGGVAGFALGGGFGGGAKPSTGPAPAAKTPPKAPPAAAKAAKPPITTGSGTQAPTVTPKPEKPAAVAPEFGTSGLTDMLSKPKTDRNGNIAWSDTSKPAPTSATPQAKPASTSTSIFRFTPEPLPAAKTAETGLPPPTAQEITAGASLPPPMASQLPETDVSILYQ